MAQLYSFGGKGTMKTFKQQLKRLQGDAVIAFIGGAICMLIAVVPPYGGRTVLAGVMGTVTIINGWRLHRSNGAGGAGLNNLGS